MHNLNLIKLTALLRNIFVYVDVPDDQGIYHKWLIIEKEISNQFPKYLILPINYELMWIERDGSRRIKRKMWGVLRSQSSYNCALHTGNSVSKVLFILCWEFTKSIILQHKDEISLGVNVVERQKEIIGWHMLK